MRSDRDVEQMLEEWLEAEAEPLPRHVLGAVVDEASRRTQLGIGRSWSWWVGGTIGASAVTALALAVVMVPSLIKPGAPSGSDTARTSGTAGTWVATDCASAEDGHLACDRWGDGSVMTLRIGAGDTPVATLYDSYGSDCRDSDMPSTFVGSGEFDGIHLWLTFGESGCGRIATEGRGRMQLYHDPGSDTLWEDEDGDGWGYTWHHAP